MKKGLVAVALAGALLVPAQTATATSGPIAGVRKCPAPYVGVIVYHVDYNTGGPIDLVTICVPVDQ